MFISDKKKYVEPTLGLGFGAKARAALASTAGVAVGTPDHLVVSTFASVVVVVVGGAVVGGGTGNRRHSPGLTRTSSRASDVRYDLPLV